MMISTVTHAAYTLTPAVGGGYFVINNTNGFSIGRVQRNRAGVWESLVRSPYTISGWEPTSVSAHCTRAAAAAECMRERWGAPV